MNVFRRAWIALRVVGCGGWSGFRAVTGAALWRIRLRLPGEPRPRALRHVRLPEFDGWMHLVSDELSAYYAVVLGNLYEFVQEEPLQPDWVVLDVGAHIGFYAVTRGRRLDPARGGRLFAFEPNPAVHDLLVRNIEANGLADRVRAVPLAVSSSVGESAFVSSRNTQAAHLRDFGSAGAPAVRKAGAECTVRTTTLDAFVEQEKLTRIDLLKINIEGAEMEAFRGGAARALAMTRRIIFSYEASIPIEEIARFLEGHGFRLRRSVNDLHLFARDSTA